MPFKNCLTFILTWLWTPLANDHGQLFNPFARANVQPPVNLETELARLLRSPASAGLTPQEEAGLATLRAAGDPTAQLTSARQRFEQFTAPSILAARSAAGFGRTDPTLRLAEGFAPVAAQIEGTAEQRRAEFGAAQIRAGEAVSARRTNILNRALQVLGQLQNLRIAQANLNAATIQPRGFSPLSQRFLQSAGEIGGVGRDLRATPGFAPGAVGPQLRTQQQVDDANLASVRARQAAIDARLEQINQAGRAAGGATEIFGPTDPQAGNIIAGRTLGQQGGIFGGTITAITPPPSQLTPTTRRSLNVTRNLGLSPF